MIHRIINTCEVSVHPIILSMLQKYHKIWKQRNVSNEPYILDETSCPYYNVKLS